jgi:hypothetical protein
MIGIQIRFSRMTLIGLLTLAMPGAGALAATEASPPARKASHNRAEKLTDSAKVYYVAAWGIDHIKVSYTASGNLIRFSYRVVEPRAATPLGDVKSTPYLVGQKNNVVLRVPVMEKVGQLRQTGVPTADQEYWMVFSNKGNLVRVGDRVNVVIGSFHADGLMVE